MPTLVQDTTVTGWEGVWFRQYSFEGYKVIVSFLNDRSASEIFLRKAKDAQGNCKMPVAERDAILSKNLGEAYKAPATQKPTDSLLTWTSSGRQAKFIETDAGDMLVVTNDDYLAYCQDPASKAKPVEKKAPEPAEKKKEKNF
ncbi:hypothetical protein WKV53_02815 [Luteolibacter sp. Y139]|uniref:Uncharacterized protein n=2 Tax=Luteolibacter soli TaxID=3135280 RepID=A0ABU9ANY0_9BACT